MRIGVLELCLAGVSIVAACSPASDDNASYRGIAGAGGSSNEGGSGGTGQGGSAKGGSPGSGGSTGAGGSQTGGSAGAGGSAGSAGSAGSGGASGAGGSTGGSAGADAGVGGAAGKDAGVGGSSGKDAGVDAAPETGPDASSTCAQAIAALVYSFEGSQGWTHGKLDGVGSGWTFDSWERGVATSGPGSCHGGTQCWATNLDNNYIQCQRAFLASPVIDLSSCASVDLNLVFWHWYDFWTGDYGGNTWYDGGTVEFSSNGGTTWATPPGASMPGTLDINPNMGSSYACVSPNTFHVDGLPGYTGAGTTAWTEVDMPIAAQYRTSQFMVRFAYATGVSYQTTSETTSMQHAKPGWYIDDVSIVAP